METLTMIALRTVVVYVYLLILVRIVGKNGLAETNALQFVLALVIGDLIDDFLWGEVGAAQFGVATASLALTHWLLTLARVRMPLLARALNSPARLVVRDGRVDRANLRRERINRAELLEGLRLRGVESPAQARAARVEPDGRVSVLLAPATQSTPKN